MKVAAGSQQQKMSGKRKGKKAASDPYVPQDLCEEILCRLPSRVLLKLKVVCKDWLRLISSNGFIQKHLQRSKADCNNLRIVIQFYSTAEIIDCANNTSKGIHSCTYLLGCCDGLIIYYDSCLSKIAALNPCTGESILLVRITNQSHLHIKLRGSLSLKLSWFGHHPFTAQYVLLLVYCESGSITFELYSLSPHRNIDSLPLISSSTLADLRGIERSYKIICEKKGTLLHGRLHFLAVACGSRGLASEFVILVYDFETNKIMKMSAHPALIKHSIKMLGVVDGCLCAIQGKQVWMMKEYGVKESWTRYAKLDGFPLAFCPNGDVIIASDGFRNVVSKYSLREREAKIISKFSFYIAYDCIATVCIDSLISPTLLGREEE